MRRLRSKTQQKKRNDVHNASEPILAVNLQEAAPVKPDSVAAVVAEEPLHFVMGEMALWGVGMATLLIPVSLLGLAISPFIAAGNMFRPGSQAEVPA